LQQYPIPQRVVLQQYPIPLFLKERGPEEEEVVERVSTIFYKYKHTRARGPGRNKAQKQDTQM